MTEKDVAGWFTVARPTAKAAVERLVHEGLLHRQTNKTARVPVLRPDDIRDLYYSRGFLERQVMVELARQRLVPDEARTALRQFDAATDEGTTSKFVEHDIAFHRALVDALKSPRLTRLYGALMGEVHLCMAQVQHHRLLEPATIAAEHAAIVTAITAGDEARAVAELDAHLRHAQDRLTEFFAGAAQP